MNRAKVVAAFVFGAVLATAGTAVAVTISAPDPINACVSKKGGELRILDPGKTCNSRSENPLSWNVQGPQGLPGAPGAPGPQGEPGTGSGGDYPDVLLINTLRNLPGSTEPIPADPKNWPLVGSGTFPGRGYSSNVITSLYRRDNSGPQPSAGSLTCAAFYNGELAGKATVDTLATPRLGLGLDPDGDTYYALWRDFELGTSWASLATITEEARSLQIAIDEYPANTELKFEMRCFRVGNEIVIGLYTSQVLSGRLPFTSDLVEAPF
jgi:hypothetical protein